MGAGQNFGVRTETRRPFTSKTALLLAGCTGIKQTFGQNSILIGAKVNMSGKPSGHGSFLRALEGAGGHVVYTRTEACVQP